jgi:hypothetical protein
MDMPAQDVLQSKLAELMRTLLSNNYEPDTIRRVSSEFALLDIHKTDTLGIPVNYTVLFSIEKPNKSSVELLEKTAVARRSRPIILSEERPDTKITWYHPDNFYQILGGPITSGLILAPDLPDRLEMLGMNTLPSGLVGDPDDLFEEHVKECLQFLLNSRAWRYGQDRLFEKVPDGLIFGKNNLLLLFDAKAYGKGFTVSADDVRRFTSYVEEFHQKYEAVLPRIYIFLVVSAKFNQRKFALTVKSNELYAKCQTKLSFLEARELGKIVDLMKENIGLRNSIDWKLVFSSTIITEASVKDQLLALNRDNLL